MKNHRVMVIQISFRPKASKLSEQTFLDSAGSWRQRQLAKNRKRIEHEKIYLYFHKFFPQVPLLPVADFNLEEI